MSKAKNQVIDRNNIGIYADFGSESEDDDWERKAIEKEDEEIRDFVKCHPLPPREDFDFWKSVLDRVVSESNVERFKIFIHKQLDIIKRMYENLTNKDIIIQCGKELNRRGGCFCMSVNMTLLSIAMDELNDTNNPCLSQMRVIEHWWDGIGEWKA